MTQQQNQSDEPSGTIQPGFSFDKHINVGHVLTTLAMAASIFFWGNAMDKRVTVLEERARAQEQRDSSQDSALAGALLLLRNDIADLRGELREQNRRLERYLDAKGK